MPGVQPGRLVLIDIVAANPSGVCLAANPRGIRLDPVGGKALQVIKANPAFDLPREKTKSYFSRGDLHFSQNVHLSFVCGAGGDTLPTGGPSLRSLYIAHTLERQMTGIVCVRAETATTELLRQLEERERTNLAHFEKLIAETVDSILIFPESPGSFAELGFFSAFESISKKTLVAVREEFQDNSFISLGPIHYISSVSGFKPTPIAIGLDYTAGFDRISNRLVRPDRVRPYRERFEKKAEWKEHSTRHQLALLDEIIEVTGALTEPDLKSVISDVFGKYDISLVRMLLSLLVAMNRIKRNINGDIFSTGEGMPFMECDSDERTSLKARWLASYQASQPETLEELRGFEK